MMYTKYIVLLTTIILFGVGCTQVQDVNQQTDQSSTNTVSVENTEQTTTSDSPYSGTYVQRVNNNDACVTQYTQHDSFGTFSFSYPCEWEVEETSGYIIVHAPDKLGYIKYPGYALSHVEPYDLQESIATINTKRFTVLSVFESENQPATYKLFAPKDGDLNSINSEEVGRDNNGVHVKYSEQYREDIDAIISTFTY